MRQPRKTPVRGSASGGTHRQKRGLTGKSGKMRTHGHGSASASASASKTAAPKKTPKTPKRRQWSPGADVACCSAEALGLLLGEGASIEDTLAACVPALRTVVMLPPGAKPDPVVPELPAQPVGHSLILGVQLAEPHAIAVTPDGTWWSWGMPFYPDAWPELVIEEAYEVLL